MDPRISAFLDVARANVHLLDIPRFCPDDPGGAEYVRILSDILGSGDIPESDSWFLSDAFYWMAEEPRMDLETKDSLRNYRIFLNSIALESFATVDTDLPLYPYNYVCYHLINDAKYLDSKAVRILCEALEPVREFLKQANISEFLFFRFGEIVLYQMLGDIEGSENSARELLKDESEMVENRAMDNERQDGRFLVGATRNGDRRKEWIQLGIDLKNPNDNKSIAAISEMLATGGWPSN